MRNFVHYWYCCSVLVRNSVVCIILVAVGALCIIVGEMGTGAEGSTIIVLIMGTSGECALWRVRHFSPTRSHPSWRSAQTSVPAIVFCMWFWTYYPGAVPTSVPRHLIRELFFSRGSAVLREGHKILSKQAVLYYTM